MKLTTIGKRLTRWRMFLQSYDFTIIYTAGRNNVLTGALSQIYKERTSNTEAEIIEDPTINKSFSALTFLLSSLSPRPVLTPFIPSLHYQQCYILIMSLVL
jgi:hypothetical protein